MIDAYEREVKALEVNDKIKDKLMIISVYNEIFNHLRYSMSNYYRDYYENVMRDTFIEVISDVTNSKEFLEHFLEKLKKHRLSKTVSDVLDNINYFLDTKDEYIDGMDYVETIDKYDLPFNIKTKILVLFRNHINAVLCRLGKTFGESDNIKEIANDVIDYLDIAIDSYLTSCEDYKIAPENICNSLEEVLQMGTKVALINKYLDGELSFDLIVNPDLRDYFQSFREVEQKVLLMGMIYGISGYDNSTTNKERVEEICKVLGISKVKYHLALTSLTLRQTALLHEERKEKGMHKKN